MTESQSYELDRLRAANIALTNALEVAIKTIERITRKHGPFTSADGTLALAKAALQNNKR